MRRWKGRMKRVATMALAVALMGTSVEFPVLAAENFAYRTEPATEYGVTEAAESSDEGNVVVYTNEVTTDSEFLSTQAQTAQDFVITGTELVEGDDYTYSEETGVLTILSEKEITIANADFETATTNRIEVAAGVNANVTLAGVHIDVSEIRNVAAFQIADNSTGNVTIKIADGTINKLYSGYNCAGLQKNGTYISDTQGKLEIQGDTNDTGLLEVTGGMNGAGIGGGYSKAGTNITISGGVITATSGTLGAGIGGGRSGEASHITISGGSVKIESYGNLIGGGDGKKEVLPTDGKGNKLYLLKVENNAGADFVIDGVDYPDAHGTEKKLYVYLTGKEHVVKTGDITIDYIFNEEKSTFFKLKLDLRIEGTDLSEGQDYTFQAEEGLLTILSDKEMIIANAEPETISKVRIEIASGVNANVTLAGVHIDVSAIDDAVAFKIADDSTGNVTITLADDTANTLLSSDNCAGLQKNGAYISETQGKLVIQGDVKGNGFLDVTGGDYGAGIGGGYEKSGTNITITGGMITVHGGAYGAGIGGGISGEGTNIIISGGSVKIDSYNSPIGGGYGKKAVLPTDGNGNSVYLLKYENITGADIVIDGVDYPDAHGVEQKIYVYLTGESHTLKEGDCTLEYTFNEEKSRFFKLGFDFVIEGTDLVKDVDYRYIEESGLLTILSDKEISIANAVSEKATENRIEVAGGVNANIILAGVYIDVSDMEATAAFKIADDSTGNVTITLADDTTNRLSSGEDCAGLQKNGAYISETQGKLVIQGDVKGNGFLDVTGGDYGAGIGGGYGETGANITINGGMITATGSYGGAGIGGGYEGDGTHIVINGGVVTSNGGLYGAGIGGGCEGVGTNIMINGGAVTTTSKDQGVGIGGGYAGVGTNIMINGGAVTAIGGGQGAAIGGWAGTNITISGGEVHAIGGWGASAIGGSVGSDGVDITISGGVVIAEGGGGGAGIGAGANGSGRVPSGKNITISGGIVTASGGSDGAGIGGGYKGTGTNIVISGGSLKVTAGVNGNVIGGGSDNAPVLPTDGNGNNVYLLEIENIQGEDIVIGEVDYPDAHDTEAKIYAYLPAKTPMNPNKVAVGAKLTEYCYDTENSKWIKVVKLPKEDDAKYTYTGEELTYGIESNDDYAVTGNKQTEVGTYTVTLTLKENRIWSDGTTGVQEYEFRIDKKTVEITHIPTILGTYGQKLSEMALSHKEAESDNGIVGTWSITEENKENIYPTVGTNLTYGITFTPADTQNCKAVTKTTTVDVEKKQLTVSGAEALDRDYDGTNQVTITDILLSGVVKEDDVSVNTQGVRGNISSSHAGTYTYVTLPELTLTGAKAGNYVLVQPEGKIETQVTIAKADCTVIEIQRRYRKSVETVERIDLTKFLPADCGSVNYVSVTKEGAVTYADVQSNPAVNAEGILEYTVANCPEGASGTITVIAETQNYKDITIMVSINIINKLPVFVKDDENVSLNRNILTYGEALSALTFKTIIFVDDRGNEVKGTLAWKEPHTIPDVGSRSAVWVFTPEDLEGYETIEERINLVVNKAVPVVSEMPAVAERVYDPFVALTDRDFTGGKVRGAMDTDKDGECEVIKGTWTWKKNAVIPTVNNQGYVAVFTPQDTEHYENVEVTVEVPVSKANAVVTIENSKKSYIKNFTDEDFDLKGITFTGEGKLTYTVADGKTLDGEAKETESIITVSENGMVSIHGIGRANIYVTVSASENYNASESQMISVEIGLIDKFFVEGDTEYTYTGKAIKPAFKVYDGLNGELVGKKDYRITYKNNTKAYTFKEGEEGFDASKAPQAIIKGKGTYSANMTVYFTILPKDISDLEDESIVIKEILLETTGKVQKKVPAITYNKKKLAGVLKPEDGSTPARVKDFVYSYPELSEVEKKDQAFQEAGIWKVLVEGTGNYTGSRYVDVIIAVKGGKMTGAKIKSIPAQEYLGEEIDLTADDLQVTAKIDGVTTLLKRGTHYHVRYKNNTEIGTAMVILTGIPENGFSGSKTANFKITGTSIAKAEVTGIADKIYNGNPQTQDVTVSLSGKVQNEKGIQTQTNILIQDKDYTISYDKNVDAGTAKINIKGIGVYTGTIQKTFKITAYDMTGETDAAGNSKEDSLLTEAGGLFERADGELLVKYVKGGAKPAVKLFFDGKLLTEGKDYKVSYKNNKNVYTWTESDEEYQANKVPTLIIKGKGNFQGSVTKTFKITGRALTDAEQTVTMTVSDKAVSTKKGGYLSKPVLTDADGKVLKQGKDYTTPVYSMTGENGETVILAKNGQVTEVGTVITVTVKGLGAYAAAQDQTLSASYRITERNFSSVKVASISKAYTGSKVTLTEEDFYKEDGKSKVTIGNGKNKVELKYGVDFEIIPGSYKNNVKKGTASVTLRGISDTANGGSGLYGGTKTIKFKVGTRVFGEWFWWKWF